MDNPTPAESSRRQGRFFYGWWVLAAASMMGMFGNGAISSGFPRFFEPIRLDLGLSAAAMALVFSLARAEGGVGGPLVGWLVDRFGARPMIFIGGLTAGVGLMLLSQAQTYWQLVILFAGVVSLGKTASLGQTLMAVVNQWFIRRRALALSTVMTSFAAGGGFIVLLLDLGWRTTMLYTGIFITALTIPVALVVRSKPEDLGLRPDGDRRPGGRPAMREGTGGRPSTLAEGDFTVREALRTGAFWLLLAGVVTRVSAANAVIIHIFPMLQSRGLDPQTATVFVSIMFFTSIPLRFLLGVAGGRFAPRMLLFWGMNLGAVGLFALWGVPCWGGVILFVIGLAVVEGVTSVNWLVVGDYFSRSRFASLMGTMSVFHNIGLFISPVFAGWIKDQTDSYAIVLLTFAPMFMASAVYFAMARRPSPPATIPSAPVPVEVPPASH